MGKKELSELTPEELGRLFPIMISPYNYNWPILFNKEKIILENILGPKLALRIEHFGSTAVPGLSAKPTIDILVITPEKDIDKDSVIEIMTAHGYIKMHEVTDHIMFVKGYTINGIKGQAYHIHMGPSNDYNLSDRIYFRDFLRVNKDVAKKYEELKKELASEFKYDREGYTNSKTDFIKKTTDIAKKELM